MAKLKPCPFCGGEHFDYIDQGIIVKNGRKPTMLEFISGMFIGAVIGAAAIALLRAGKDER